MLLSSPVLTGEDPLVDSPVQLAMLTAIEQTERGTWRLRLKIHEDVYREGERYRSARIHEVTLELGEKQGLPSECALKHSKGILFLK